VGLKYYIENVTDIDYVNNHSVNILGEIYRLNNNISKIKLLRHIIDINNVTNNLSFIKNAKNITHKYTIKNINYRIEKNKVIIY